MQTMFNNVCLVRWNLLHLVWLCEICMVMCKATISSYLPKPWNIVKLNNPLCRIEIFNLSFFVLNTSFRLISNNSSKYLDINFMMKTGVYVEYNRFLSRKNFFKGMKRTKQYLFICFEWIKMKHRILNIS